MSPIISPWWIYVYGIIETLNEAFVAVSVCAVIAAIILVVLCIINYINREDEIVNTFKPWIKPAIALFAISGMIALFVPSQDTLIYMQIARYSTPENLEQVVETTKDAVDYVIDAVQSIKGDVS